MDVPQQDERTYKALTLNTNHLDCLLVSDASTDKAAAAVSVCVGQLQDPPAFPGLAHLLEHMLFLGTEAFPQENEYDRYLSQHSGHSNAYTDLELTCYYCDCQAEALEGALARLGACLTAPLLQAASLEREIQAVDSEHAKNKQQDHWRSHQLSRTIIGGRGTHPYAKFGSGNLDVLLPKLPGKDNDSDNNKTQRIQLLREQVQAFYQRYYKAPNMKLVLLGQESIADLERMAQQHFGRIPSATSHRPDPLPPLLTCFEPTLVHWIPVCDSKYLDLQWILPEQQSLYRYKPARYLSHLLGHEGQGSLLQTLRQRAWAQELSADDVSKATSAFTVFALHMELTQCGLQHVTEIIQMVYAYVSLVQQQMPSWLPSELAVTADTQFRFLSQREPAETVSSLAVQMQHYAPKDYLSGPYKMYDYKPALMEACWECLRPDNMVVLIGAKELFEEHAPTETDPWYGTRYTVLPREEMQKIQQLALDLTKVDAHSLTKDLALPERNDMLATDFDLLETPYDFFQTDQATPRCVIDNDTCRLWYKPDTVFGMPKVNAMFLMRTPIMSQSPHHAVLAELWTEVVHELCNEFSYVAYMAGLHCDFSSTHSGIELTVSGYNHKADVLLQRISKTVHNLPCKLTTEMFDRVLDKLEKKYLAFMVAQPYQHALHAADLCVEVYKWSVSKRLACLPHLQPQDLHNFHQQLLSRFQLEALVHGNVSAQQAVALCNILLEAWKPQPLLHQCALRVVQLSSGNTLYRIKGLNEDDDNSCVLNLFQVGPTDLKKNAVLSLFLHLVREPAFNQLRTEEQLGKEICVKLLHGIVTVLTACCRRLVRRLYCSYQRKDRRRTNQRCLVSDSKRLV